MGTHCDKLVDSGRRKFLTGATVAAVECRRFNSRCTAGEGRTEPRLALFIRQTGSAMCMTSKLNEPLTSLIPMMIHRASLIKLGKRVPSGAGPEGDIVGFSTTCPHKGFPLAYNQNDRTLNCPGHYSRFDVEAGGQQTWGHATQNLPQYMLRVDSNGDIYAEGVDELLYGRLSNVL